MIRNFLILCLLCVGLNSQAINTAEPIVFYAGTDANTRFLDTMQCSDGSILVLGVSDHLDWLSNEVPRIEIPVALPVNHGTRVTYILQLSADTKIPLRVIHMPAGTCKNLRWIRTTSLPGETTGNLFASGQLSDGYFIARLNANFVDSVPTGFDFLVPIKASNGHESYQPWDVAGNGSIVYGYGGEYSAAIGFLNPEGEPRSLPKLRASHWVADAFVSGTGDEITNPEYSTIRFPTDLRSWTDDDLFAKTEDGNGGVRQGTWPLDIMTTQSIDSNEPIRTINGRSYGYNGYRSAGRHWIGGIAVDRKTGDFYFGFNVKSVFWDASANKEQPDFEPAVIGYAADGTMKWWTRLYTEAEDANKDGIFEKTYVSPPDQYIDGIAIDYSNENEVEVIVVARCHGNNTSNFWSGNTLAANPGGRGFQNSFTGTEGNIHISYLCRLSGDDGQAIAASYLAGFFRKIISGKGKWPTQTYSEPIHDGWPSHNSGWPDLTTTRIEPNSLRVDSMGRVHMVGLGPRMVTTRNAFQKLPKRLGHNNPILDEGTCPWNNWVRAYEPMLDKLAFSSALTGEWTYPDGNTSADPVGASNTFLRASFPVDGGVLVVGHHSDKADGVSASGHSVPTANIPSWGSSNYSGVSGIIAFLPFGETAKAPREPTNRIVRKEDTPANLALEFSTEPLRTYRVEHSDLGDDWISVADPFIGSGKVQEWSLPADMLSSSGPDWFRVVAE